MYCPRCGMQAGDGSAFCRSCGANLDLVSKALTGELVPPETADDIRRRARAERITSVVKDYHDETKHGRKRRASPEHAITSIFTGLGFLLVAFAALEFAPAGRIWWFWMLIPAFTILGKGISQLFSLRLERQPAALPSQTQTAPPRAPDTGQIATGGGEPGRDPYRMGAPPSVVEGTTKLMDRADQK
jgi:hypothetical protein